jgi:uncharacterized protein DUF3471/glyoxalase superfamily protein
MRDFRDAKAMAQTLRDVLKPKAALTRSESLEAIAKIFGFQDWNVLAAKIQSDGSPSRRADIDNAERQEIRLEGATLDRYVGFYQLSEGAVMTISRDGDQLISRLTGQPNVRLYAESTTEFFAKVVNAQISFIMDTSGRAESLVLHQNGRDVPMKRIDAIKAKLIEELVAERLKSQQPSPGTEPALRRLAEGLRTGNPNYEDMGPGLAEATRRQLEALHRDVSEAGAIQSIRFVGVGNGGVDVYAVQHEHRVLYWRIGLDPDGKTSTAWISPGL